MSATVEDLAKTEAAAPAVGQLPTRRVIILGASYGTRNMGVNALAAGAVASILAGLPGAKVAFMDYGTKPCYYRVHSAAGELDVPLLNIRYSKRIGLVGNVARLIVAAALYRVLPSPRVRARLRRLHPRLDELLQADLVVALSGGDSFSDIYGLSRLLYVCLPQVLALAAGRPLVLLPQTVGPFSTWLGRWLGAWILRRARRVYCRDAHSLTLAHQLAGSPGKCLLARDLGFILEPIAPQRGMLDEIIRLRQQGPLVGLNISGLLYAGGYTKRNQFRLHQDYRDMVSQLVSTMLRNEGVRLLLVPHVFGGSQSNESDLTACELVFQQHAAASRGRLHYLRGDWNHHEVKFVIGQCDFFLGSRMHACIAALSQCVPAVGLAYSRKFAGVFATVECEDLVIDLTSSLGDDVSALVQHVFTQRLQWRAKLQSVMPSVRQEVLSLFRQIEADILSGNNTSC